MVYLSKIPIRIGFDRSAGRFLFTHLVFYNPSLHEIDRNISLLSNLIDLKQEKIYPKLYPDESDKSTIDQILNSNNREENKKLLCVAPGSIWQTKRWTKEGYIELIKKLIDRNFKVFLLGSNNDYELCNYISSCIKDPNVVNLAGKLNLLQSAELIRRCLLLVSNDSAPVHIATAMGTPVVAIFGPTSPSFGFYPYYEGSSVVEIKNLHCRPCRIHGSKHCPTKKFECMTGITHEMVLKEIERRLSI